MEFQSVAKPKTESELAVMICMLEAYGIPHYVQNQGFGGLYPGMQIDLYNVRRLMVPVDRVTETLNLLAAFSDSAIDSDMAAKLTVGDRLRVIGETLLFGWSFPTKRNRSEELKDDASST